LQDNGAPSEELTDDDFRSLFEQSRERIVNSKSKKKLVASGPGTGKTTLFKHLIDRKGITKDRCLALTFLNNLKSDLEQKLCDCACVYTFHGYCKRCLHRDPKLRTGLTDRFVLFPEIGKLVASDWEIAFGTTAPDFVAHFRNLRVGEATSFFLSRSEYYDAVAYDDSVYRAYSASKHHPECREVHDLLIVDEYQDFNLLEVSYLQLLAQKSPVLIVGDDDQALYQRLRSSDPEYIRELHGDPVFEKFDLPFCLRCTRVVVDAFHDIVSTAVANERLRGRISKGFRYFPPVKRQDSQKYPKIKIVHASTQNKRFQSSNYFGRYIVEQIDKITSEEIQESRREGYPTVLIIGPKPYLPQIQHFFDRESQPYEFQQRDADERAIDKNYALAILDQDPESNLGWRVLLEVDKPDFFEPVIKASIDDPGKRLPHLCRTIIGMICHGRSGMRFSQKSWLNRWRILMIVDLQ
jgi:hypothetical protein